MENKAADFNKTVKEFIFPVFPLIAEEFLQKSGIKEGVCLDVGAGNGYLGLAIAEKSRLQVRLIDIDSEILHFAEENIQERKLSDRVKTLKANVEELPFADNFAQLIVSRGSIFFWNDQVKGLNEIYRVLAPGGMAFIGGGFFTRELLDEISTKMTEINPKWESHIAEKLGADAPQKFRQVLKKTDIPESKVDVIYDSANLWIVMKK